MHKDTGHADKVRGVQQKSMTGGYWAGSGTVHKKKGCFASNKPAPSETKQYTLEFPTKT